ncbi:uncharacterized protein TNCV_2399311 [Trichonephila clavipes]|uniref:Uncharacterized protein n=1 Tax=Trichonephila clavipes TaxID=2585209 RepID=A0A8X6VMC6_TRICX|nr:uncharacterized protein TNCV_2399311 [Trichonephila clavipes]
MEVVPVESWVEDNLNVCHWEVAAEAEWSWSQTLGELCVDAGAEWYKYRIVTGFVMTSSPVLLKTRRVGQRCTLNLSRAETSCRWCGLVARRGGASSGVVHVT